MASTGKFGYIAHHFILLHSISLTLVLIGRNKGLSTLCYSCCFDFSRGCRKYSWPWLSLLRRWGSLTMAFTCKFLYIAYHLIIYGTIPLSLVLIGNDSGLSTLCHSCRFNYQERIQKIILSLAISTPRMGYTDYGIYW